MPLQPLHPSRMSGLAHLSDFLPLAGKDYASQRNFDRGPDNHPNVSCLSPYIRHRTLTEREVLQAVLGRFSLSSAEKYVQEVFWRTYWKGWLEQRPTVWTAYKSGVKSALNRTTTESGLRERWDMACRGNTGIDCFDAWAQELIATGYLHNHARMWFASIWIFTLRLPWELGADFFMRHLLDGDPASNTLSWKWVAGLQTVGKNYTATASNIAKYTDERFNPLHELAKNPQPLKGPDHPSRGPVPQGEKLNVTARSVLLLHDDDLSPGYILDQGLAPIATALCLRTKWRSPLKMSQTVLDFTSDLCADALNRYEDRLGETAVLDIEQVIDWAQGHRAQQIVTPFAPVGPNADMVHHLKHKAADQGIHVASIMRSYDAMCWPHATHGFFRFKENIPDLVQHI